MKPIFYNVAKIALVGGFVALAIFTLLFLFKTGKLNPSAPIDTEIFDNYGSLIGGFVGALFSLTSILLLIHTIQEQKTDTQRQKVESRFFELLKIHLENRKEIQAGDRSGKYAIQRMVREARICIDTARRLNADMQIGYDDLKIINFGYLAFYFGSAITSAKTTKSFRFYTNDYATDFVDAFIKWSTDERQAIKEERGFTYNLFSGHQIRLNQYFRHLHQTITYIDEQPAKVLSYSDKYEYIKTLRAQLSPHEQSLLLYSSLSILGREWEKVHFADPNKQLITKYNLVKNMLVNNLTSTLFQYFPCVEFEGRPMPECRKALLKIYR